MKIIFEYAGMKLHDNFAVSAYCDYCENRYYVTSIRCPGEICNSCFYSFYSFRRGNSLSVELKLLELEDGEDMSNWGKPWTWL